MSFHVLGACCWCPSSSMVRHPPRANCAKLATRNHACLHVVRPVYTVYVHPWHGQTPATWVLKFLFVLLLEAIYNISQIPNLHLIMFVFVYRIVNEWSHVM